MNPASDLVSVEYEQHKSEVIRTVAAKLSASGVTSSHSDLDASYNEAWHALYMAMADGQEIENRVGYLVTVTHRRALNEHRAMKVSRRADPRALSEVGVDLDIDARLDAEIQLRHVREGFRSKLSSRELEAATLCHLYGYTRPEAAEAMGVKPKRMEKIMDSASGKIASVVETVRAGEHCAELGSGVRAFSLGVLDPEGERYAIVSEHLDHCPACRREVWTERGLAAIGPPLPLAFALLAGGTGAGSGAAVALGLKGGGSGGAAAGKAGAAGASTGRKAAIAGGVAASVAVVAVAVAAATGTIGGGDGGSDPATPATLAGSAGSAGSSSSSASTSARAAKAAKAARLRKAARARREAREKAAAARAAQAAAASAAAEAAAEPEYVPEPVYVPEPDYVDPPPEPVTEPPVPPEPKPDPKPDPEPEPVKPPDQGKPTTDAGEEFGLR